jgi:hypothetical protein
LATWQTGLFSQHYLVRIGRIAAQAIKTRNQNATNIIHKKKFNKCSRLEVYIAVLSFVTLVDEVTNKHIQGYVRNLYIFRDYCDTSTHIQGLKWQFTWLKTLHIRSNFGSGGSNIMSFKVYKGERIIWSTRLKHKIALTDAKSAQRAKL